MGCAVRIGERLVAWYLYDLYDLEALGVYRTAGTIQAICYWNGMPFISRTGALQY